jgi:rfaE bifunctional protein kinase chain/domain
MRFSELFENFSNKRILVVGDVMIDAYIWGSVSRISPEAPVPIVQFEKSEDRLGGAANVALNLVAMGAQPIICSVIGKDEKGKLMQDLFHQNAISTQGLILSEDALTTVKTRVLGNKQQLLRIDDERVQAINTAQVDELVLQIKTLIDQGVDAIILEDYNKGVLVPALIEQIVDYANEKKVPTTVDPKKDNFLAYKNVTLFKPNLKELKEGLNQKIVFGESSFDIALETLEAILANKISFVTLSENGVYIKKASEKHHVKAHLRNITDVSGAGDTVISVATLCLTEDMPLNYLAEIANIAGGLVCEKNGVVSIDKNELLQEVIKLLGEEIVID